MAATQTKAAGTRRVLALGSLGLAALGLGLLGYDVFTHTQRGTGWLPLLAGTVGLVAAALWQAIEAGASATPTVPLDAPREGSRRVYPLGTYLPWITAGALLVLVIQALVPLRYYMGDDVYDERFSWRMFSAIRMHECSLRATETVNGASREVPLMQTVQAGWVTTLNRNREAVMQRYLRWRCEQEGVERARLHNACVSPEGRRVPPVVREIDCASGEITEGEDER